MATVAVPSAGFSIKTQAAYPIRLGDSLTKPSDSGRLTTVKYNFKPQSKISKSAEVRIGNTKDGESELAIKDNDGAYAYSGLDFRDEESFVLVVKGSDKGQEMVLEKLDGQFGFNVVKTPSESNASKLATRYPHLPTTDNGDNSDNLFGEDDEDVPADDSNPFDYRHFLKAELDKLEEVSANVEANRSSAGTPIVRPQATAKTNGPKAAKRAEPKKTQAAVKRKSAAAEKVNMKRVKAGTEPQVQAEPAKSKQPPQRAPTSVPEVRMDRRASTRRQSVDDSGDLILENEDDSRKPMSSAMTRALSGGLATGSGPMSLRSAASSPASRVESPAPPPPEEEFDFDFGDGDGSSPAASHHEAQQNEEEDDDADVEDLELNSPNGAESQKSDEAATAIAPLPPPLVSDQEEEEDDDGLNAALEAALAADDDGGAANGNMFGESDEESEEE